MKDYDNDENIGMDEGVEQMEVLAPDALQSLESAQISMQVSTAKKWPRDIGKVKSAMLSMATLDEETAASCFYSLPRGGKMIQGPSIRMAEIAVSCFQNIQSGVRPISAVTTGPNPHVICQAVAYDVQNNNRVVVESRRRITKKKSKAAPDEDDIQLATAACSAIAYRTVVFKVVPLSLVKPVFLAAKKVAIGEAKSLVQNRLKYFDRLKQMGAKEANILAVLGVKKIEEVNLDHLETLVGIGTALKDGSITVENAFPDPEPTPKLDEIPGLEKPEATKKAPEPTRQEEVPPKPPVAQEPPSQEPIKPNESPGAARLDIHGFFADWKIAEQSFSEIFDWLEFQKLNPKGHDKLDMFTPEEIAAMRKLIPKKGAK